MKIIFYQTVNTDKPKLVASLVFVCTTENVLMRDAILIGSGRKTVNRSFSLSRNEKWIGNRPVEEAKKMKCYNKLIYKQFM